MNCSPKKNILTNVARRDGGGFARNLMCGGAGPKGRGGDGDGSRRRSVVEVVGQGLVEDEFRRGFTACGIEAGGLVQEKITLRRTSGRGHGRRKMGQLEV